MKSYKTKLILICLILMLLNIMFFSTNIEAASFSVSASKNSVTVGETFNIIVNGTGLTGRYSVTSTSNVTVGESVIWVENTSVTITCTATGEGNATVTVTPITVADATTGDDLTLEPKTVNIKINTNNTDNTGGTTPPSTSTKSSEARLKNLGFNPEDFTGFRRDKTEYNVEVSNSVSSVKIYATPVDSKATVTGTGTVNLKEGLNTVRVTVTAEDGVTKKTYTMNITRLTAEEDNPENETEARLKNLGIRPTEYDFSGFKRDNTSYTVEVPNELTEVEVYAEAVNPDAKITGTGKVTLQEGENTVNIEVTAPDGTTKKTYTLIITRTSNATEEPEEPTDNEEKVFGLSQLLVKGQNLSPKFSEDVYEYTIGLTEDLSSLDIEPLASDENATIEIAGNENLQNGENIITILVSNAETGENATYQIIVNKNVQDEAVVGKVEWLKPSTWGLREKIIVGVIIVLVIIIIVAIVIKVRLSRRDDDDMDLPGGEELDRALSEHQEIEDEVSEAEKDISETEENVKSDAEIAQEYFESYSKRRGKHF